jgi:peptidoglycan hydrolase CwlO-like protein
VPPGLVSGNSAASGVTVNEKTLALVIGAFTATVTAVCGLVAVFAQNSEKRRESALSAEQSLRDDLQAEVIGLREENRLLRAEIKELHGEIKELHAQIQALNELVQRLQKELQAARA